MKSDLVQRMETEPNVMLLFSALNTELTNTLFLYGLNESIKPTDILNVQSILKAADSIFAAGVNDFQLINKSGYIIPTQEAHLVGKGCIGQLEYNFGKFVVFDKTTSMKLPGSEDDKSKIKADLKALVSKIFIRHVRTNVQVHTKSTFTNMFVIAPRLTITDQRAEHRLSFKKLSCVDENAGLVTDDFGDHFPEFFDFLDLLCAARFSPDRRQAFLWLNCPKSWGKNLLLSALDNLNLVTETSAKEAEACFEGKPVGIDPNQLARSWVLAFDEAKTIKSEMKQVNNHLTVTPKYGTTTKVPVYLKLFLSAEGIDSLAGAAGVEAQLAERFSYMTGEGRVQDREVFNSLGSGAYLKSLTAGIAAYINNYVKAMREMGEEAATLNASRRLIRLHEQYKITHKHQSLEDSVKDYVEELRQLIIDYGKWKLTGLNETFAPDSVAGLSVDLKNRLRSNFGTGYYGKDKASVYYLKRPVSFVKAWLNTVIDRSEVAKVAYKSRQICESLSDVPVDKTVRVTASTNAVSYDVIKGVVFAKEHKQINTGNVIPINTPSGDDITFF